MMKPLLLEQNPRTDPQFIVSLAVRLVTAVDRGSPRTAVSKIDASAISYRANVASLQQNSG
jgi:hypothetical protein